MTHDKTTWGPGPWHNEPDRDEWRDEATGLPCLAVRGPAGAWCGYVGVPPTHPWHGRHYSDCSATPACEETWCAHAPCVTIDVHGGLTYAAACQGDICHVPAPGEQQAWWFGFDCAHAWDVVPSLGDVFHAHDATYRTPDYVRREVTRLAAQLAAVTA